jgi:spore coat protein A, manganese oxidase
MAVFYSRRWLSKSGPPEGVEPRRYRFRLLNGSNARFYTLSMQVTSGGGTAPVFWQIGSDAGYLYNPVRLSSVTIAPAERMDLIVDFSGLAPGTRLPVKNSANAPFPGGDPVDPAMTGQVMQLRVVHLSAPDTSVPMSTALNLLPHNPIANLRVTAATVRNVLPGRRVWRQSEPDAVLHRICARTGCQ